MKCTVCGNPIQQDDAFCTCCGAPASGQPRETVSCPYCRGLIFAEDLFCQHCGQSLAAQAPAPAETKPPVVPRKKKKRWPLLVAGVAILAVLAVVFFGNDAAKDIPLDTVETKPTMEAKPVQPEAFVVTDVAPEPSEEKLPFEEPEIVEEQDVTEAPVEPEIPDAPAFTPPDTDVEILVAEVRDRYNDIMAKQPSMAEVTLQDGVAAYVDHGAVCSVTVLNGVDGVPYSRFYYYDTHGQLVFAYLEGTDAHRLYFYEGHLMRWRYSPNAAAPADAVNHDWEGSESVWELESFAWEESCRLYDAAISGS